MNPMRIGGANQTDSAPPVNHWTAVGGSMVPSYTWVNITTPNDLTNDNWQVPSQTPRHMAIRNTAQSVWGNLTRAFGK